MRTSIDIKSSTEQIPVLRARLEGIRRGQHGICIASAFKVRGGPVDRSRRPSQAASMRSSRRALCMHSGGAVNLVDTLCVSLGAARWGLQPRKLGCALRCARRDAVSMGTCHSSFAAAHTSIRQLARPPTHTRSRMADATGAQAPLLLAAQQQLARLKAGPAAAPPPPPAARADPRRWREQQAVLSAAVRGILQNDLASGATAADLDALSTQPAGDSEAGAWVDAQGEVGRGDAAVWSSVSAAAACAYTNTFSTRMRVAGAT